MKKWSKVLCDCQSASEHTILINIHFGLLTSEITTFTECLTEYPSISKIKISNAFIKIGIT